MSSGWSRLKQRWASWMQKLDKKLHEKNEINKYLEKVESKINVPRLRIIQTLLFIFLSITILSIGSQFITNSVAFIYPAYASIKAIETGRKEDDTRWLTYWIVFGLIGFVESFTDIFLYWFPFYWLTKCLFLIWCMLPNSSNGSDFIFNFLILPLFLKHHNKIDNAFDKASTSAKKYLNNVPNIFDRNGPETQRMGQNHNSRNNYNNNYNNNNSYYGDDPYEDTIRHSKQQQQQQRPVRFQTKFDELREKYGDQPPPQQQRRPPPPQQQQHQQFIQDEQQILQPQQRPISPNKTMSSTRNRLFRDSSRSPSRKPREDNSFNDNYNNTNYKNYNNNNYNNDDDNETFYEPSSHSPVRGQRQVSRSGREGREVRDGRDGRDSSFSSRNNKYS